MATGSSLPCFCHWPIHICASLDTFHTLATSRLCPRQSPFNQRPVQQYFSSTSLAHEQNGQSLRLLTSRGSDLLIVLTWYSSALASISLHSIYSHRHAQIVTLHCACDSVCRSFAWILQQNSQRVFFGKRMRKSLAASEYVKCTQLA